MNKQQKALSVFLKSLVYFSIFVTIGILVWVIYHVTANALPYFSADLFAWEWTTENQSMVPSIINTLTMIVISLAIAVPIGIFSAVFMVEYAKTGSKLVKIVRPATETLQGIPSIVYGLFGNIFFVNVLNLQYSIWAGAFTMAIMILPLIMRSTEEALIAVDDRLRQASYGLGAKKLRTVFNVVLPPAMNGIFSGIILAMGRVFGETAALIYTAGMTSKLAIPNEQGATLSVQMYKLYSEGLHPNEMYVTAFVLLVFVVLINLFSSYIGSRLGGKK